MSIFTVIITSQEQLAAILLLYACNLRQCIDAVGHVTETAMDP